MHRPSLCWDNSYEVGLMQKMKLNFLNVSFLQPVKVRPGDLLHADDVYVEREALPDIADNNGNVVHRGPEVGRPTFKGLVDDAL